MELGCLLGGSRCFINSPVQVHRHGEDWSVYWPRLGEQAILQPWSDLVQTHQGVHWLVGVYGFTVEDCRKSNENVHSKHTKINNVPFIQLNLKRMDKFTDKVHSESYGLMDFTLVSSLHDE